MADILNPVLTILVPLSRRQNRIQDVFLLRELFLAHQLRLARLSLLRLWLREQMSASIYRLTQVGVQASFDRSIVLDEAVTRAPFLHFQSN